MRRSARSARLRVAPSNAVVLTIATLLACEPRTTPQTEQLGSSNEPSPNAQILPEPLSGAQNRAGGVNAASPAQALVRKPLVADRALRDENVLGTSAAGFEFVVDFFWPEVRRGPELGERAELAHASWLVEGLSGAIEADSERVPHQRVLLKGALFQLPQDTEIRSRGDRFGHIVVWPDGRSYRTVPEGALSALFEERRVDVMPPFAAVIGAPEVSSDGKKVVVRKITSPLGELTLRSSEDAEWSNSGALFCDLLLEFLRVREGEAACPAGEIPLEFKFVWAEGGELRATISGHKRRTDLRPSDFSVPPVMPIFKPGELPPQGAQPWPEKTQRELWPSGTGPQLSFKNALEVPMLLLLDGLPAVRLEPDQEWQFAASRPGVRYQARDFLGQHLRGGGLLNAPAVVHLGAEPELVRPEAVTQTATSP